MCPLLELGFGEYVRATFLLYESELCQPRRGFRDCGVHQYLANVLSLVDESVAGYQRRGFKNLMVSFGCTGGQHRSVYLAEQLAKRLWGRNGVEVVVRHLELENMNR